MISLRKYIISLWFVLILFMISTPAVASKHSNGGSIDLKEILLGHIKDSYEWHITTIGDTHITIPLPIIVKSSTGWHMFLSNEFSEETDAAGSRKGPYGLYIANNETHENKICEQVDGTEVRPFDISVTKSVVVLFINAIVLLLCILIPAHWCKKHKPEDPAPRGFVGLMHMFILSVYEDVIVASLGKKAKKYAPYLLTCFFFIFISNLLGVMPFPPGGGNITGNITITFFLALCTFIVTNVTGTREYWKEIFWPEVPTWLKVPVPLMPFIEFFSIFTKPLALMIRLFANMMAGHAIALSLVCTIFIMFALNAVAGSMMTVASIVMSIFMMFLELLVCYIQALVFTMLSAVFISLSNIEHEGVKD